MSRFIVTAAPVLHRYALAELRKIAPDLRRVRRFTDGVSLVETGATAGDFSAAAVRLDPVFVRHLMSAQVEVALSGLPTADLPALLAAAEPLTGDLAGEAFSVQCRRVGDHLYTAKDVEVYLGSALEAMGAVPRFSDSRIEPDESLRIVSVYLFGDMGYIGCSTARENLNEHSDECRVFSRHPRQVSRAEFKLQEALRKFGLAISSGQALDLGAAPGGWTRVLADLGMQVTAVDPAQLDRRVLQLPGVTHVRAKAQCLSVTGGFDLLVNDMNLAPDESAAIMCAVAPLLKPGAFAVMTVKLIVRQPRKLVADVRAILEPAYEVLRAKHLFHNRQEVTLLLRRRQG